MHKFAPLAFVAAAALTLTGCSDIFGQGSTAASSSSASPSDSATPVPGTDPSASPSGGPTNGPDEDDELEAQIAANCPEGRWLLDNDAWADLLQAVAPDGGSVDSVDGEVFLNLGADGSYSSVYQDWTITMSVEGGTSVITRDGTDSGGWSDSDGVAVLNESTANSVVTGYVEAPEGRFDMPTTDGVPTNIDEDFAYECQGQTLLATTDEGTITFTWAP